MGWEYDHTGKKVWGEWYDVEPPEAPELPEISVDETPREDRTGKIFGIGYPKTGSTSLALALTYLRYQHVFHDYTSPLIDKCVRGDVSPLKFLDFQAYINVFPKEFFLYDQAFPNSKFILTTRDTESWFRSISSWRKGMDNFLAHEDHPQTMHEILRHTPHPADHYSYVEYIEAYGCLGTHRESFIYKFEQHTREVEYYFKDRPNDLLVLPLESPAKRVLLSNFLSRDWPPDVPYPHEKVVRNQYYE